MSTDPDDALHWEGDEETPARTPRLPRGWKPVGKGSENVETVGVDEAEDAEPAAEGERRGLSTPLLVFLGVIGGAYLLYTVGWILGGLQLQGKSEFLVTDVMYQVSLWAAVLAPALWFAASWVLTRKARSWVRVVALVGGAVVLIPWPFVLQGMGAS